jgi:hypothetical protein
MRTAESHAPDAITAPWCLVGADDGALRARRHTRVLIANLVTPFWTMVCGHIARPRMILAVL